MVYRWNAFFGQSSDHFVSVRVKDYGEAARITRSAVILAVFLKKELTQVAEHFHFEDIALVFQFGLIKCQMRSTICSVVHFS